MYLEKKVIEDIAMSIKECKGFFMFFYRTDPEDKNKMEIRRIANIDESKLFDMILQIFSDENFKMLDKLIDYSESLIDENPDENCGPLTYEQINKLYEAMIEKDKKNENMA